MPMDTENMHNLDISSYQPLRIDCWYLDYQNNCQHQDLAFRSYFKLSFNSLSRFVDDKKMREKTKNRIGVGISLLTGGALTGGALTVCCFSTV